MYEDVILRSGHKDFETGIVSTEYRTTANWSELVRRVSYGSAVRHCYAWTRV